MDFRHPPRYFSAGLTDHPATNDAARTRLLLRLAKDRQTQDVFNHPWVAIKRKPVVESIPQKCKRQKERTSPGPARPSYVRYSPTCATRR